MGEGGKVGYLPQHLQVEDGRTLVEEASRAFEHLFEIERRIAALNEQLTTRTDYESEAYMRLIEEVNHRYGNTVIMVTHNDAIKNMADRVVKLRDGQIRKNYVNEEKIAACDLDW